MTEQRGPEEKPNRYFTRIVVSLIFAVVLIWLLASSSTLLQKGEAIGEVVGPILMTIADRGAGPLFAAVILLLFAATLWRIGYLYKRDREAVEPIRNALGQYEGMDDFPQHFPDVDEAFNHSEHFRRQWHEFNETIIKPDPNAPDAEENGSYRNPVRPYEYFSPESTDLRMGFVEITPNLFVGLGLLLTFAGLIAAIAETSMVFGSGAADIDSQQDAIGNMLNVTATKFYSSFAALLSSLILNSALTVWKNWRAEVFHEINDKIELGIHYISPSELALEQIEKIAEQTRQLQTFNTDLAAEIGRNIKEALADAAGTVASQVQEASVESIEKVSERLEKASEALNILPEKLQTSSDYFSEKVESTVREISDALTAFSTSVEGAINDMALEGGKAIKDGMKPAIDEATRDFQASFQDFSDAVRQVSQDMNRINESLGSTAGKMKQAGDELDATVAKMSEVTGHMGAAADLSRRSNQVLGEAINEMTGTAKSLTDASRSLSDLSRDSFVKMEESLKEMRGVLGQHAAMYAGVDENIAKVYEEVNQHIEEAVKRLSGFIQEMDRNFSSSMSSMSAIVESLEMVNNNFINQQ